MDKLKNIFPVKWEFSGEYLDPEAINEQQLDGHVEARKVPESTAYKVPKDLQKFILSL